MSITTSPAHPNGAVAYHHDVIKAQEAPKAEFKWNVFDELGEGATPAPAERRQIDALVAAFTGSIDGERIHLGLDFTLAPEMAISVTPMHASAVRVAANAESDIAEDAKHIIYRVINA